MSHSFFLPGSHPPCICLSSPTHSSETWRRESGGDRSVGLSANWMPIKVPLSLTCASIKHSNEQTIYNEEQKWILAHNKSRDYFIDISYSAQWLLIKFQSQARCYEKAYFTVNVIWTQLRCYGCPPISNYLSELRMSGPPGCLVLALWVSGPWFRMCFLLVHAWMTNTSPTLSSNTTSCSTSSPKGLFLWHCWLLHPSTNQILLHNEARVSDSLPENREQEGHAWPS